MAFNGTIYPLTVDKTPSSIIIYQLVRKGVAIRGSNVASTNDIQELLQFSARNNVHPQIQHGTIPRTPTARAYSSYDSE
jgi:D-arabinose 1-dehydrogenase-like Zn-dependent alcohol dehydrogenase